MSCDHLGAQLCLLHRSFSQDRIKTQRPTRPTTVIWLHREDSNTISNNRDTQQPTTSTQQQRGQQNQHAKAHLPLFFNHSTRVGQKLKRNSLWLNRLSKKTFPPPPFLPLRLSLSLSRSVRFPSSSCVLVFGLNINNLFLLSSSLD